ncbi:MAG: hypothetical protein EXS19_02270 [Pedosphaera sp.]|nr:hypothetical protein [Pedosphaera sp.]
MPPTMSDTPETGEAQGQKVHLWRGGQATLPPAAIHSFGVGQTAALSSGEVHRFKSHNEALARTLAARLSIFLRMELTLEVISLEVVDLPKFIQLAPAPRHMILFQINPLQGACVFDIAPALGLTLTDRMLGGKAFSVNPNRPLREVETALLDQLAMIALKEWCGYWKSDDELTPALIGYERNPRFLQLGGPEETFYHIAMEASIGDCINQIQMLMPVRGLNPLLRKITFEAEATEVDKALKVPTGPRWNKVYDNVRLRVSAHWPHIEARARDLLNMKVGDVIPVPPDHVNKVQISLAGLPKFVGRLGSADNKCAVEITQAINH